MTEPNERSPLRSIVVTQERSPSLPFDGPFGEFMSRCPKDVSEYMLTFLDAKTLCTLSEAMAPALNRSVRAVPGHISLLHALTSDRVWKPLIATDFKDRSGEAVAHGTAKKQYLQLHSEEIARREAEYLRLHPPVTFRDGCSAGFHFYQEVMMPCVVGPMFLIFFALLASRLTDSHEISITTFIPLLLFVGAMGIAHFGMFYVSSFRRPFPFRDDTFQESRSMLKMVHQLFGQHPVIAVLYSVSSLISLVWFIMIALFLSDQTNWTWDTVFIPSWVSSGISGFMQLYVAIKVERSLGRVCNAVATVTISVVWMWYLLQKLNGNQDFLIALWLIPLWIPSLFAVLLFCLSLRKRDSVQVLVSLFLTIPVVVFLILLSVRDAGGDISYKELFAPLFVPLSVIASGSWFVAMYAFKGRFMSNNVAPFLQDPPPPEAEPEPVIADHPEADHDEV